MHCPSCGADNRPDATVCDRCATPLAEDAPLGTVGGRYRLRRLLGQGSRKRVYLAWDTRLDRQVALAVVQAKPERDDVEARAMGRLTAHPNVVTVYDTGEDGGRPFIVSEYMAGGDLRALLARAPGRRLSVAQAVQTAEQIAAALDHAHARGIVHRDLKPANVWLTADGVAKLGDFGLALARGTDDARPGTVAGTAAYVAPEQALGGAVDARSDLYALGAVLYEMLTGRPPFVGDDAAAIIAQHVNSPPIPPSALVPAVPPALDDLVLRLLAKAPRDRPPAAADVRAGLGALARPAELDRPDDPLLATAEWRVPARRRRPSGRRVRVALVVAAVGVAALLVGPALERGRSVAPVPAEAPRIVVGVMSFTAEGSGREVEWTRRVTRDGLNAILSKVGEVRVYSKEMIDFRREKYGLGEVEVAQQLGITKMVSGTIALSGQTVSVELRLVDIASGFLEASVARRGPREQIVELQNDLAAALLDALGVQLSPERRDDLFAHRRSETLERYEGFYDTLGDVDRPAGTPAPDDGSLLPPRPWRFALGAVAWAQEGRDDAEIRALLEAYRLALEAEDIERLASLHLHMSDQQRAGLARYFAGARDLRVQLSGIDIAIAGDEALVSYTREDAFQDERSGRPVHLDTRLSRLLAKRDGVWKIGDRRDP